MNQESRHQLLIRGGNANEAHSLLEGVTTLGKASSSGIQLTVTMGVADEHCRFVCRGSRCTVEDLNSPGSKVNNAPLPAGEVTLLNDGDVVLIGLYQLTYRFVPTAAAEEPTAPAETPKKRAKKAGKTAVPQPPTPIPPPASPPPSPPSDGTAEGEPPPDYEPAHGLEEEFSHYLKYLPEIFHDPHTSRFLALLESILAPITWNVDNFDYFLDPEMAPHSFLPWLANWFDLAFDDGWDEARRRQFLRHAPALQARHGTQWALSKLLTIYTEQEAIKIEDGASQPFHTFTVTVPLIETPITRYRLEQLINQFKPAHTSYTLHFAEASHD